MEKHVVTKISTDGTRIGMDDRPPTLDELQDAVGGLIEIVRIDQDTIMVVNEEGLIIDLAVNPIASGMVRSPIMGDVVIMPDEYLK